MEKIFEINGKCLYLEKTLVELADAPIYFVCRNNDNNKYLCLCTDIETKIYYVVSTNNDTIAGVLNGSITMRDALLKKNEFWEVQTGESTTDDTITLLPVRRINKEYLPTEDSIFKVATPAIQEYANKIDSQLHADSEY